MTLITKKLIKSLGILLILFPFLFLLGLSFSTNWRFPSILPLEITPDNWLGLFSFSGNLFESFILSIVISVSVGLLSTFTGFLAGKYISETIIREKIIFLSYLPYTLSPVLYAASIYYYFVYFNLTGNIIGVIVGQILITFPFSIILFTGYWNSSIKNLENLVLTLGGTKLQSYLKVLIPISKRMLLIVFFQTFIISWFEYGLTTIIGVGKIQTLTIRVYQFINEANYYYAALSSCLLIIPPAFLLWFNKKYVFRKII